MKLFTCQHCGQLLYFENTACERCGRALGFLPELTNLSALEPEGELTRLGVPPLWDFVRNEDDRKAIALIITQQMFQRPYLAAPGVPQTQLAILRSAFEATMRDREFLADAQKTRIDINPLNGAALQDLVAKIYATPKSVVERAKEILKP